jgi:hypothetical protein
MVVEVSHKSSLEDACRFMVSPYFNCSIAKLKYLIGYD